MISQTLLIFCRQRVAQRTATFTTNIKRVGKEGRLILSRRNAKVGNRSSRAQKFFLLLLNPLSLYIFQHPSTGKKTQPGPAPLGSYCCKFCHAHVFRAVQHANTKPFLRLGMLKIRSRMAIETRSSGSCSTIAYRVRGQANGARTATGSCLAEAHQRVSIVAVIALYF